MAGGLNLYQHAPISRNWIDPLGLQRKCYDENEPNWTPHGYKHVAPKNSTWKDVIKSKKSGPVKYKRGVDIEPLERSVYKNDEVVSNGKPWKVKGMGENYWSL